jgi:hypothetical protein
MPLKLVPYFLIALAIAVIGYGTWQRQMYPPQVIATGIFEFTDKLGTKLMFPKRVVSVAGFQTTEIQLPGGTWIDSRADCEAAVKAEHSEIWDTRRLQPR